MNSPRLLDAIERQPSGCSVAGTSPGRTKSVDSLGRYGANVAEALRVAWEATDRLCSKRLHPFLPELSRELEGIMRGYLRYLLEREVKSTAWLDMLKG